MSELNELLDELEALAKAMPASEEKDDAKIQAAAEEGKDAHDEPDGDEDDDEEGDADGDEPVEDDDDEQDEDDEDERLGKSFAATLGDGSSIRAYDGTELVKSLMAASEAQGASLLKAVGATTTAVREMQKLVKAQSAELQTLRADLARIGGEGRGRKTLLNVHEKPPVAEPPANAGVSGRELMTKAMSAFKQGRISGTEVATLEAYLGRGMQPPGYLLDKM